MNWLRHELRLRAHKIVCAIQFMERDNARNHDAIASIHDGNAVKSFKTKELR